MPARIVPEDFSDSRYRVTAAAPCPVCEKPDWCLSDGTTWALCQRVESDQHWKGAGYFHRLGNNGAARSNDARHAPPARRPVAAPKSAGKAEGFKLWPHLDDALEAFDVLKPVKDDDAARKFFQDEYGLDPDSLPDDWRVFEYPKLGRGVAYRGRAVDGAAVFKFRTFQRFEKNGKWKRKALFLFGAGGVLAFERSGAALVIVGGEEKALAAWQSGFAAVSELTGEKAPNEAWIKNITSMNPPRIVLAHDHDQAGEKANAATAAALEAAGYPVDQISIVTWPPDAPAGFDLNHLAKAGGPAAICEAIEGARTWQDPNALPIRTLDEIFSIRLDDSDNFVGDRVIALDEINLLIGPPGVGKSTVAIQLFVDAAYGRPWLGSLPIHRRDVRGLYLGTENSIRRTAFQLGRQLHGAPASVRQHVTEHLFIMVPERPEDRIMNVCDSRNAARIAAAARRFRADFVIVDPWIDFFGGDNENDAIQTRESLRALLGAVRIHKPDVGLLLSHHSRVGATAAAGAVGFDRGAYARGSKALLAACRSQINIAPGDEENPVIILAHGKSNNGRPFQTFAARLDESAMTYFLDEGFCLDDWKATVSGKTPKRKVADALVLEYVRQLGGKPKRAALVDSLMHAFDLGKTRGYEIVADLIKAGKLFEAAGFITAIP